MPHSDSRRLLGPDTDPRAVVGEHLRARTRLARIVLELGVLEATAALAAEESGGGGLGAGGDLVRRAAAVGRTCVSLLERQVEIDAHLLDPHGRRRPRADVLHAARAFAAQVADVAGEAVGIQVLASARVGDDGVADILTSLAAPVVASAGDLLARLRDAVDVPEGEPDSRWAAKPGLPTPLTRAQRGSLRARAAELAAGRDRLLRLVHGRDGAGMSERRIGAWVEAEAVILEAARQVAGTLTTLEVRGLVTAEELDEAADEMLAHRIRGAALPRTGTATGESPVDARRRWRAALLPEAGGDPLWHLERAGLVARVRLGAHRVDRLAPIPAALPEDVHGPGRRPAWKENGSRRERWLEERAEERRQAWINGMIGAVVVLAVSGVSLSEEGAGWLGLVGAALVVAAVLGVLLRRGPGPGDLRTARRARDHARRIRAVRDRLQGLLLEEESAYLAAVDPDPAAEAAHLLQTRMLTVALREAEELGETPSGPGGGEDVGRRVDALEQRVAVLERGEREAGERLASLLAVAQERPGRRWG